MDIKSVNFFQNIKDTWISVKFVNLVRYRVAPIVWEDDQHRFTEASEGEKNMVIKMRETVTAFSSHYLKLYLTCCFPSGNT